MDTRVDAAIRPPRDFAVGAGLLLRGLRAYAGSGGLVLLGVIPAILSFLVLLVGFGTLVYFVGDVAALATWFADDWAASARSLIRLVAGIAILGAAGYLSILIFTALTLALGDPFYEKIAERVEDQFGGVPNAVDLPWYREIARSVGESVRLLAVSASVGVLLFVAGFLPAVGQTVVPVIGAVIGGWFLAVELTGVPFARRGIGLRERRRLLRGRRWLSLGFGVSVFVCFLIPLGAVVVMPAAVVGATLLSRRVLGLPIDTAPAPGAAVPVPEVSRGDHVRRG
ncbi:MAG TPA: EI24 domain-containing protein [Micromonosporaceae bacterium]